MKKLLALLFIGCIGFAQAQDKKPTKEETIAFINRTINEVKGRNMPFAYGTFMSATLSENKLVMNIALFDDGRKICDIIMT